MVVSAPALVLAVIAVMVVAFVLAVIAVGQSQYAKLTLVGGIGPFHWQMNTAVGLDIATVKHNWLVA